MNLSTTRFSTIAGTFPPWGLFSEALSHLPWDASLWVSDTSLLSPVDPVHFWQSIRETANYVHQQGSPPAAESYTGAAHPLYGNSDLSVPANIANPNDPNDNTAAFNFARNALASKNFDALLPWPGSDTGISGLGFRLAEYDPDDRPTASVPVPVNDSTLDGSEKSESFSLPWRGNDLALLAQVRCVSGWIFYPNFAPPLDSLGSWQHTGKWFLFRSRFNLSQPATYWIGLYRQGYHVQWTKDVPTSGYYGPTPSLPTPIVKVIAENQTAIAGTPVELPFPTVSEGWPLPTLPVPPAAQADPVWQYLYFVVVGQSPEEWVQGKGYTLLR